MDIAVSEPSCNPLYANVHPWRIVAFILDVKKNSNLTVQTQK